MSTLRTRIPICLILSQKLPRLRRYLAATAAFSAGGADGQRKSKCGFGIADNPKCLCIRHIHGQGGGAERAGFFDGMKKLTRTFAKETLVFVVAEVGTDEWFS